MILSDETLDHLWAGLQNLLAADKVNQADENHDDAVQILNDIKNHCGLDDEDLKRVGQLIQDAGDPDFRCPK